MESMRKGLVLGGIFAAEVPDKSGETLSIANLDISSLESGTAFANSEHAQDFKSQVGRVIRAKKIFKDKDCESTFEKKMFESVNKVPILIGYTELFDDEDHAEAKAIASIAKNFQKNKLPLGFGFSIEGGVIDKDSSGNINKSIARKVAITAQPCNAAAKAQVLENLSKSEQKVFEDLTKNESKDVFSCEIIEVKDSDLNSRVALLQEKVLGLKKALEAGMAAGAPSSLTQGAALQKPVMKAKKPEETTGPGEETTAAPEDTGLKPINNARAKDIDKRKDKVDLDVKLKKAELFAYQFFKDKLKNKNA